MHAIYIAALLVLLGSDILPSKVNAGSSKSSDSRGSKGSSDYKGDETYCKQALLRQKAVEDKTKNLNGKKQPLPTCTCGASGTISKVDILDASCGKTTSLVTCLGCTGPQVPVKNATECNNVADCFRGDLDKFCAIVFQRCKSFTMYRCSCPAVSTTQARTTPLVATTTQLHSVPSQTTTSVPPAPATTSAPPAPVTTSAPPAPATTSAPPAPATTSAPPAPVTTSAPPAPAITSVPPASATTLDSTPFDNPGYGGV